MVPAASGSLLPDGEPRHSAQPTLYLVGHAHSATPDIWGLYLRLAISLLPRQADEARHRSDALRMSAGRAPLFVYRSVYCPGQGMFRALRHKDLALGSYVQVRAGAGGWRRGEVGRWGGL